MGRLTGLLGGNLVVSKGVLGTSWGRLGVFRSSWVPKSSPRAVLEATWAVLVASWGRLGRVLGRLGAAWTPSWGQVAVSGASWGRLGRVLGRFGGDFGAKLGPRWRPNREKIDPKIDKKIEVISRLIFGATR